MKMKRIITVLFIFVMMFTLAACSSTSGLVGWWTYVPNSRSEAVYNMENFPREMLLEKGGDCRIDGYTGNWQANDGELTVSLEWFGNETYNYKLSGNELVLSRKNHPEEYITLEKK